MRAMLVLLLLVFGCALPQPKSFAVILIDDAGMPVCGATAIGPRLLVTAAHCVNWGAEKTKRYETDAQWYGQIKGSSIAFLRVASRSRDLAWLDTATADPPLSFLGSREAIKGERVYSIAPVFTWDIAAGKVEAQTAGFLETTVSVKPGWSGSPVIGLDGKLIGVVSSCTGGQRFIGLILQKYCLPGYSSVSSFGLMTDDRLDSLPTP